MYKRIAEKIFYLALGFCAIGVIGLIISRIFTLLYAYTYVESQRVFDLQAVPAKPVAIVFGAGLLRDGSPTSVLRDRVALAADLYKAGKVEKLLMSGDNRTIYHNEPESMRRYALSLGVPDEAIVLDYAGLRTYDTCYRARHIFGIQEAILVTQSFHLPRSIYTCNTLGVSSVGVPANRHRYSRSLLTFWNIREMFATVVALWEVHVTRPLPILGKPEPILTQISVRRKV